MSNLRYAVQVATHYANLTFEVVGAVGSGPRPRPEAVRRSKALSGILGVLRLWALGFMV